MSYNLESIVYTSKTEAELSNYFIVTYQIKAKTNLADAAWNIALGQSVGSPSMRSEWETQELFENHSCLILHSKSELESLKDGNVKIAFPEVNLNLAEDGISQLFVEVLGGQCDIDIIEKCRVIDIQFTENQLKQFQGPKIGLKEIKRYCSIPDDKPIFGTIVKPKVGLGSEKYFDLVKCLIDGCANFCKEDEILSNQDFCPISKRLPKIVNYLERTKSKMFYCVSINADPNKLLDRVKQVYELGGNGVHVNVHCGFGAYRAIRELDLPILVHYQKSGDKIWTDSGNRFGFDESVLFKIIALSGCGTAHCGMLGGYLNEDEERTKRIVKMLADLNCAGALSCGLHPGLVNYIKKTLGHGNFMANVGGALFSHPGGTLRGVMAMRQAIDGEEGPEYKSAIEKWGLKQ